MSTATATPAMTGPRTTASPRHSGATAVTGKSHFATRALRAVRVFTGAAVSVVLLGDHADDWRNERDAWADGRGPGTASADRTAHSVPQQQHNRA
ncbi:hypothetical protein ACFYVL_10300 [Streptomyces sp. NPDC004111]|uniref:hypothetical protein n=1 Tax=Streptomyces sp. NPDC004111 TaxID=3364690 RepID=UPI003693D8CD